MRAGPLRTLVQVQRPSTTTDARGQTVQTWSTVARIRADLRQLSGREREAALQIVAEATWRAMVRYTPGLTIATTDRLKVGSMVYDVLAVVDLEQRHRTLQIELREHQP